MPGSKKKIKSNKDEETQSESSRTQPKRSLRLSSKEPKGYDAMNSEKKNKSVRKVPEEHQPEKSDSEVSMDQESEQHKSSSDSALVETRGTRETESETDTSEEEIFECLAKQ